MEVILHGLRTDRKKKMTCKQVQKRIIDFINDDMDVKELGTFIEHLESCDECKEEYDVYYTLIMGMRILDSDNLKGKTKIDSQEKINSAKSYLFKWRIVLLEKILLFIFICIGIILVYWDIGVKRHFAPNWCVIINICDLW